jgi:hypothetical protein
MTLISCYHPTAYILAELCHLVTQGKGDETEVLHVLKVPFKYISDVLYTSHSIIVIR